MPRDRNGVIGTVPYIAGAFKLGMTAAANGYRLRDNPFSADEQPNYAANWRNGYMNQRTITDPNYQPENNER